MTKEELIQRVGANRHPNVLHLVGLFADDHLPEHLQTITTQCIHTVIYMCERLQDSPELSTGLRKLLEAKDCFVRSAL